MSEEKIKVDSQSIYSGRAFVYRRVNVRLQQRAKEVKISSPHAIDPMCKYCNANKRTVCVLDPVVLHYWNNCGPRVPSSFLLDGVFNYPRLSKTYDEHGRREGLQ
jgi:hypothetical protein